MADTTTQARLDAQDAKIAALSTEVTALRRQVKRKRTIRRFFPLALAAFLVALIPLPSLAAISFNDLNPNSVHNPNIQAIADAGITTGCDPGVAYCPNRAVTREEMASFLARTAGLGTNPPVANAKTAQTANMALTAVSATNANTLGGLPPNALIRVARTTGNTAANLPITADPSAATWTPLLTLNLAAPEAGFVLANGATTAATGAAACNGGLGGQLCPVEIRLRDTATGGPASPALIGVVNIQAGGNFATALSPTYVFPVPAGAHTFVLEGASSFGAGNVLAANSTLTALFVPFAQDGGPALAP